MAKADAAWNAYFDEFGCEPQNATKIFNRNKGKGILLILLCGLPGSGKTTLAMHFEQQLSSEKDKDIMIKSIVPKFEKDKTKISYHHICYDSFLFKDLNNNKDINGNIKFDNNIWKESRNKAYIATESLIANYLKNKMDNLGNDDLYSLIFVDDNMYFRSMRYKFYKLAKEYSIGFLIIYLNTNKNECIKRNDKRKGMENVDISIIQRMSDKFQAPNSNKYGWESNNCFTFIANINALYDVIRKSWTKIPIIINKIIDINQQNETRKANIKSLKHQSDLRLRKSMSKWMKLLKENSGNIRNIKISEISKQIINFRKDILNDITKCVIDDEQESNIITEGFEQQFDDMIYQYFILLGIELSFTQNEEEEEKKENIDNNWKPSKMNTVNITLNFFADTTRIYWNKSNEMKRDLWEEYIKIYKHLASINHKEMNNQQRTKHVHVAITSIAIYRALKKINNYNDDIIRKHIKGMFHSMLKTIFKGQQNKLKRSNNAWNDFKEYAYNGTKGEYHTFEPEFIRNDDMALFWNFNKCTFHEICIKNNAETVGPMLCDYDYILAQYIKPWITFKRDKTIACGDKICTFRYCKNESVKDIEDWFM